MQFSPITGGVSNQTWGCDQRKWEGQPAPTQNGDRIRWYSVDWLVKKYLQHHSILLTPLSWQYWISWISSHQIWLRSRHQIPFECRFAHSQVSYRMFGRWEQLVLLVKRGSVSTSRSPQELPGLFVYWMVVYGMDQYQLSPKIGR